MDYHQLRLMTLAQLRETAAGIEGLTGFTQMRKEQLLKAICERLGIAMHEHHEVVGIDKTLIKQRIRALKRERDEALGVHDRKRLKIVRRRLHRLKRRIHRATV
jgi:hypothetical protein